MAENYLNMGIEFLKAGKTAVKNKSDEVGLTQAMIDGKTAMKNKSDEVGLTQAMIDGKDFMKAKAEEHKVSEKLEATSEQMKIDAIKAGETMKEKADQAA